MKKHFKKYIAIYLTGIAIFTWAISFIILRFHTPVLSERGLIGDSFGAINALFSGLAFAGVLYTIILQREELNEQHKEQTLQRERFEQQNKTLKLQQFENTFFNLVKLHHQIVDSVTGKIKTFEVIDLETVRVNKVCTSREYFKQSFFEFTNDYVGENESLNHIDNEYKKFYEIHKTNFGHYFRNLYRIFKFIDETVFYTKEEFNGNEQLCEEKNLSEKYKYTSMVRAQLSDYELGWLFYNCACEYGRFKFLPLVNKYKLLKNLPTQSEIGNYIIHKKIMVTTYNPRAFGLEFDVWNK